MRKALFALLFAALPALTLAHYYFVRPIVNPSSTTTLSAEVRGSSTTTYHCVNASGQEPTNGGPHSTQAAAETPCGIAVAADGVLRYIERHVATPITATETVSSRIAEVLGGPTLRVSDAHAQLLLLTSGGSASGGEEEPEADPCENAIWIAQTAAGAQDGSSENDPRAISYLTSSANWGGGGSEIDPGDTVCLTGTITSTITFPGSGSSGNPVTIDGTNATLNPSSGDNLDATDRSWLVIQNMTYVDSETRTLFVADNSANIVLDNLHADDYRGAPAIFISQCDGGRSDNITIKNSFVRQAAEDFGNTQHDILQSEGATDLAIIGNHFVVRADGAGSNAHNDVIQTYESGCTVTGGHQPNENITIAYNWIEMDSNETNDRSWFMCEGLGGTNDIYRNVFVGIDGAEGANGISCQLNESGVVFNWFYNTLVAKSGASNNMLSLSGGTHNIRGNIVCAASSQTVLTGSGGTKNRSYNRWSGTNAPSAGGGSNDITNTGTSCANVGFTDYANNDFSLASGADSVDSGTDLGAPYNVAIDPSATWPDPATKALSGTADRGAYER